jgi:hypothetical protein
LKHVTRIFHALILGPAIALMSFALLPQGDGLAAPHNAGENGVRDTITSTTIATTGTLQTLGAASGDGQKVTNNGDMFLVIANSYTDTVTATLVTGGTVSLGNGVTAAIADVDVPLAAGQTKIIGPFTTGVFNQPSGADKGKLYINWNSAVTGTVANSVTLAAYNVR